MDLYTFPSAYKLEQSEARTPGFMRPSVTPYAVIFEGVLRADECETIQETLGRVDPYVSPGCGALTREIVSDPVLDVIETVARNANKWYFKYDLDPGQHSWMQTYGREDRYQRHMDGSPGQTRKLTAVAMLSDPRSYDGGALTLYVTPKTHLVSKKRGTIVVFPHWIEHDVSPVTDGERQTINMGFWGPPFR